MKIIKLLLITLIALNVSAIKAQEDKKVKPEHLTVETFKQKVFDYEKNTDQWVFEGDLPCIVDFYADWCKPCKMVAPIMDELAEEYKGKINIYKVNTEQQRELSRVFGIRSIPAVLFIPMEGKPQMSQGALPKENFKQAIDEFLLGQKKDQ
ncbi:MAG: thioredoxin [Bacteroidales bacterium]|nr:thioredoxin [Bacteroidales bacterium]MCF8404961.1 thioredoxin [Bacteroidales bacterium]